MRFMGSDIWIVGNWKMHGSIKSLRTFFTSVPPTIPRGVLPIICPAFPYLSAVKEILPKGYALGAQDVSAHPPGAFTGEVSVEMLCDLGCRYVIVGHGECRNTCDAVQDKVKRALQASMYPIICVGETIEGDFPTLVRQCCERLPQIQAPCCLAYEPIWSIGADAPPPIPYLKEAFSRLQQTIKCLGWETVPMLYGGSVTEDTLPDLIEQLPIRGVLVGRASLDSSRWGRFLQIASECSEKCF